LRASTFFRLDSTQSILRKLVSPAKETGFTTTSRAPLHDATLLIFNVTCLSTVFSNSWKMLVPLFKATPFTATIYSPSLIFNPGSASGARRDGFQSKAVYILLIL